jgi:hypothetical protein
MKIPQIIFGLQVLLSFVVYGLVARWYVGPRLATLPLHAALQPLLAHAFRHLGLVLPTVVGLALPASRPAAYGDLLAGLLPWLRSSPRARGWPCPDLASTSSASSTSSTPSTRGSPTTCSSGPPTSSPRSSCRRS